MGVIIRPTDFAPLFGNDLGDVFLLVTSPGLRQVLSVEAQGPYPVAEYSWTGPEARTGLLDTFQEWQQTQRRATVLWIAEDEFDHYLPEQLTGVKLGAISYFSGAFSVASLERCLQIVRGTDYTHELQVEEQLVTYLDRAHRILFRSTQYGTEAVFEHHQADHWFSLHGPLDYGQQTVLPTGELSALTDASGAYSFTSRFAVHGELVLKGMPVVHRGNREVTPGETAQMFMAMATMDEFPVIATVQGGLIEQLHSPVAGPNPFLEQLEQLFDADERFRKIHEIGFGTNVQCFPFTPGNFFPNERYPGVHFGLGLGGYTRFHHDLVCSDVDVLVELDTGESLDIHKRLGLR